MLVQLHPSRHLTLAIGPMKTRTEKLPGRFITVQEIGPGLWVTLNISRVTRIDIVDVPSTDPHMPVAHCLTLLVMTDDEGE